MPLPTLLPAQDRIEAPIRGILLVDEFIRRHEGPFRSVSPPGHLIHLVESGRVEQYSEGRREVFCQSDLVWYHETEIIAGEVLKAPWRFISINFVAPLLPPPPDDRRVFPAPPAVKKQIRKLIGAWREEGGTSLTQTMRVFAILNDLIATLQEVADLPAPSGAGTPVTERWWFVERRARQRLDEVRSVEELARLAGMSIRTMSRACIAATGLPPARRIKALKLFHARHLLQLTDLPVTEIALQVGYERVQELSRDMRKHLGQSPRQIRAAWPEYQRMRRQDGVS